jgi:glycosyltransferase involved in cell wall biosynthesis
MLSILTVTTLFPNPVQPMHGTFVATRLEKLLATNEVEAEVIAPVAWIPPLVRYPSAGRLDRVPLVTTRGNLAVHHPRYLVIPKIGMTLTPRALTWALERSLGRLLAAGRRFDLIDAHYFYPDGVAAVRLGRRYNLPVVVTARGTDLNLITEFAAPRKMIRDAADAADGLVTVCQALKNRLVELGTPADRVTVLRNGVDLELFRPLDRTQARAALGFTRRTLGSVGHLIERKGHHHAIRALASLPDTDLVIVGEGPQRSALVRLAAQAGVGERVRFLGAVDQPQLARIYSALDALVLASSREGWANVLLEAMACGTPVVASAVWGTPEVVAAPEAGVLMGMLDAQGVAAGVRQLFAAPPDRAATRRYAERFSWDSTTQGQLALFREILSRKAAQAPANRPR